MSIFTFFFFEIFFFVHSGAFPIDGVQLNGGGKKGIMYIFFLSLNFSLFSFLFFYFKRESEKNKKVDFMKEEEKKIFLRPHRQGE